MHADYLDPDNYFPDGEAWTGDCDPPEYGWHLSKIDKGETKQIGVFQPFDGQDVIRPAFIDQVRHRSHGRRLTATRRTCE